MSLDFCSSRPVARERHQEAKHVRWSVDPSDTSVGRVFSHREGPCRLSRRKANNDGRKYRLVLIGILRLADNFRAGAKEMPIPPVARVAIDSFIDIVDPREITITSLIGQRGSSVLPVHLISERALTIFRLADPPMGTVG